ncbi:MAG: hypothetical protein ABSG51_16540 [Terracidiphilus sp.]
MKRPMQKWTSKPNSAHHQEPANGPFSAPFMDTLCWRIPDAIFLFLAAAALATLAGVAGAQDVVSSTDAATSSGTITAARLNLTYQRPTGKATAGDYVADAFGPGPVLDSAFAAGLNQWGNAPPEWHQGAEGYAKRFGSDFGIVAVSTTARYGLSAVLREDMLYYRCACRGVFPRLRHAVSTSFVARSSIDGHSVFSVPALVTPYAGSMTAVYGWYPNRFGAMDGFRIGNYDLLAYVGGNVAREFFYSGPHSLLARMHFNNAHDSADPGPNH